MKQCNTYNFIMRTRSRQYNFFVGKKQVRNRVIKNDVLSRLRKIIEMNGNCTYLSKPKVLEWLFADTRFVSSLDKQKEDAWGRSLIGYHTNQWTTFLGENILKEILTLLHKDPTRVKVPLRGNNGKRLMPDFEASDGLYENKARTYSTTGTAGEKILGTPLKYCECNRLYGKPLFIVCMGFQEQEADKIFDLFTPKSRELKSLLGFYNTNLQIKYIRATDLLKQVLI